MRQLFHPTTAIITWMSDPRAAQFRLAALSLRSRTQRIALRPSVHASEMVHIQLNEANGQVQVINNQARPCRRCCRRA